METNIKVKSLPFGRILTTANQVKTASGLIVAPDFKKENKKDIILSNIQTVLFKGPTVKLENGIDLDVGDKVMINVENPRVGMPVFFNKATGDIASPTDKEENCEIYMLMEAREVLMVL